MRVAFSEEDTVAEDPDHPLTGAVWLWEIVRVLEAHVVQGVVVGDGEALRAKGEEVADQGAVLFVPLAVGDADFGADDGEELTPEGKTRDGGNDAQGREVEGVEP